MGKFFKKCIIFVLVITMSLSLMTVIASAESRITNSNSINEYVKWLEKEISTSIDNNNGELSNVLKQFKGLSKEKQQKFVNYLNSKEVLSEIANAFVNTDKSTSLYDGDITIEKVEYIELGNVGTPQILSLQHRKATYQRSVSMFGVEIFETTSWVTYYHDGSKVTSISGDNHLVSKNYNPTLDVDFSGKSSYISTDKTKAYSTTDISFSLIWDGLGIVLNSGELGVWGDVNNNAGGYVNGY